MYRFELLCVLFGRSTFRQINGTLQTLLDHRHRTGRRDGLEVLRLLEPWEVEEMACIRDFVVQQYEVLLKLHWKSLMLSRKGYPKSTTGHPRFNIYLDG